MSVDVKDYRVEKFREMGFDYMRALVLACTTDKNGVPVYWVDVKNLVDTIGHNAAYDLLA